MSAALTSGDLSWMRGLMETSLSRTCSVPGARTTTDNADGTFTDTTAAGSTIACSFMAAAGSERVLGGQIARVGNYILTFPVGTVLRADMTIAVNADGSEPARTFQLVAPLDEPQQIGVRWLATEG